MSDPPGKVLSNLTPGSEKRNSKLGGCAGVFFQLFDWNRRLNGKRLLPQKLLPAERPAKHGVRSHKDEKLPMAKLLLIANENRGGFPKVLTNDAEEVLNKDKTPEKKKSKRSPSVVAKLMGLETMPSPEPCKDRKQQAQENQIHPVADNRISCNPKPVTTTKTYGVERVGSAEHSSVNPQSSAINNSHNVSDTTNVRPPRALVCHKSDDPKISFFCKLPALSPRKAESALRSILSPSKTHNKLLSPIKSPLATKRGARLLEAAAKILEPNMQPSARVRGLGISSQAAAKTLLGSNAALEEQKPASSASRAPKKKSPMPIDSKKQQQSVSLRVYSDHSKAQGKLKPDKRSSNMQDTNSACKSQASLSSKRGPFTPLNQDGLKRSGSTKEESVPHVGPAAGQPRLMRSKSVREEPENGKSTAGYYNELRNAKDEKGKPDLTRQKQSSNRLSQPRVGTRNRELGASSTDEYIHELENQDPNMSMLANKGDDRNSVSADSVVTSSSSTSILNYGKLFSSHKSGTTHESANKKTQKKGDSSVMKSFLRKKGAVTDNLTKSSNAKSAKVENSQASVVSKVDEGEMISSEAQKGNNWLSSSLECITETSLDDKSPEVKSAWVSSLSEEVSEVSMKNTGREAALWEQSPKSSEAVSSLTNCSTLVDSDGVTFRVSIQSESPSAGDLHDSASSSYAHLELPSHKRKKAVSYSGKSTAAILQELLMALNSTKTKIALEDNLQIMACGSDCESSSKFSLYPRLGDDYDDSASSALVLKDDLKKTTLASTRYALCNDEWRQPSPVSTLEFPCNDDSSTFSDGIDDAQERKLLSKVGSSNHHEIISKRHHAPFPACGVEMKSCKKPFECEEQYMKDVVKTAKLSPGDIYAVKLRLPCTILDPVVFNHLEERFYQQWEWGIRPDENMYANCRSETDMHFTRSLYAEAGIQNRKLVFGCVNEAINMHLGINEHHSRQSPLQSVSATSEGHIFKSVHGQIELWRGMACCMNIDDIVEQEMSTGIGKWADFVDEVSDFAVEIESIIVRGLIDELVIDMSRRGSTTLLNNRKEYICSTPSEDPAADGDSWNALQSPSDVSYGRGLLMHLGVCVLEELVYRHCF
ncbi:hypothetical protein GOP47_0007426 [Adiantum capillus-veneris]|uniref:DUF4378 domain-containing protein n=1 Tax=Adiantum capillus-veneris TaxID=13818 RepID=A0A9D4ZKX2_ADICA|nr:hypothetical protein GOP47_0007426 [Adiantum capillus-veneris]